jgi:hypothetical protein
MSKATADLKWLRNAEHFGEWERFDETTGERESIWMMKSQSSPKVRFYAVGKGQVGKEHHTLVSATYWAYGTGYLGVIDDPAEIFLEIACRNEVLAGGAVKQG